MKASRALLVERGVPPKTSVAMLPQSPPGEGEALVQLQAAALTSTDVMLCSEARPWLDELIPALATGSFVPGLFFCGEVLELGRFVEGLRVGEPVLGVLDGSTLVSGEMEPGREGRGGCYRERVCVHFSTLLPVAALQTSDFHMPGVVAHVPPMIDALNCVAAHLRLQAGESLLIVAIRLADVIFVLQRLLLISNVWDGPLHLVLAQGKAPTKIDLEKHPLLRPLLLRQKGGDLSGGDAGRKTFLDDFLALSVEDHAQPRGAASGMLSQTGTALRDLVAKVAEGTRSAGFDVILALDVDLSPPPMPSPEEPPVTISDDDLSVTQAATEPPARPPTLFRTLVGALALRGRLVTNCRNTEVMPTEGENLWIKEASVSFINPHSLSLSAARHGAALHAALEVLTHILDGQLPVAQSEVVQFRLFEQFHHALEASLNRGARGAVGGLDLIVLIV
eukprot:gnl/TRDRNA2_/TRDRNA2_197608_c0_seq1.p1 gnl/TRDRNA2_/TRDRNA2_197608_c0~~gnl/TRDRNA2_/TRDRNA2_197608_c0_seq1.p1  ORF type:complete len:450 (+),score=73.07 gnl/TRDRNA2_/TRDRNA2_197608_c0_seq1:122-1471(+)